MILTYMTDVIAQILGLIGLQSCVTYSLLYRAARRQFKMSRSVSVSKFDP